MQKRIAILYDFDYTLTPEYMQSYGLMQDMGFDDVNKFFSHMEELSGDKEMDMCLSTMCGIVERGKFLGRKLTKDYFRNCGKNIKYYSGVVDWFGKINKIGEQCGYEIEHYIISSGLKEIIEGTSIAKYFKRIYANFYAYKNGEAFWPSQVVNYTSKTQYLYRVRKNALDDLGSLEKVNMKMNDDDVLPFKNMIYLGDSQTDIPSFKVLKNSGGVSICVYAKGDNRSQQIARQCYDDGRVNYFCPADYTEGSDLFNFISDYIKSINSK